MCSAIIAGVDRETQGKVFERVDMTKDALPGLITREAVDKEIHVMDEHGVVRKGAEAMLEILNEAYPRFRFLVWFGRLPFIKQLLPIGYRFVAANRHFIFGLASRIFYLKIVLVLALFAGILLSIKLWVSSRAYPLAPVFDFLPSIPFPFDYGIVAVLCILLGAIFVSSRPRKCIAAFLVLAGFLALGDQSRWQPWFYQYVAMMALLGLYSWKFTDADGRKTALNASRLIVAGIYFWGGVQKVNASFALGVFPWFIEPLLNIIPSGFPVALPALGIFAAFLEAGLGIGLLTRKFRNISLVGILCLHVFILFMLGPFWHDHNSVVWPWNIALMAFAVILFWRTQEGSFGELLAMKKTLALAVIAVLFWVMPFFSFFGMWDSYLSWALYSGNTSSATLYLNKSAAQAIPREIEQYVEWDAGGTARISLLSWSFRELNVPSYPAERVYRSVAKHLCNSIDGSDISLVIFGKPQWVDASVHTEKIGCRDL